VLKYTLPVGSDIDCLAVLPRHVEREQFFTIMYDMLKEQNEVTEITVRQIVLG
jgi:poly(A) polymerase